MFQANLMMQQRDSILLVLWKPSTIFILGILFTGKRNLYFIFTPKQP